MFNKKIKIQIKSWLNGEILFEYEKENNTIKDTVEEAVRQKADLRSADLSSADLRSVKNITQTYINQCSRDMLFIFEHLKGELPFLRDKLIKGEVDGTQYEGSCACLIGTLANA